MYTLSGTEKVPSRNLKNRNNISLTTDPNDPRLKDTSSEGQNEVYLVLSEEERSKGFVRPVRNSYVHLGKKVDKIDKGIEIISLEEALADHTDHAKEYYTEENGYAACLRYNDPDSPITGKFIKKEEYDAIMSDKEHVGGCGATTTMGQALAETYSRNPKFYGSTFCVKCGTHLPVNEFVWAGTDEVVGS